MPGLGSFRSPRSRSATARKAPRRAATRSVNSPCCWSRPPYGRKLSGRRPRSLIGKLDDLEARLHNPKAEISYDILAMKGGAKLYSRLSPFLGWVQDGDGPPTQGGREVFAAQKAELDGYVAELQSLLDKDLAALNETAKGLGLPVVYVAAPATP